MFGMRMPELLIIFAILLLVFGANKIPKLGEALGKTIRGFRQASENPGPDEVTQAKAAPAQLSNHAPASASTATVSATAEPAEKRA